MTPQDTLQLEIETRNELANLHQSFGHFPFTKTQLSKKFFNSDLQRTTKYIDSLEYAGAIEQVLDSGMVKYKLVIDGEKRKQNIQKLIEELSTDIGLLQQKKEQLETISKVIDQIQA